MFGGIHTSETGGQLYGNNFLYLSCEYALTKASGYGGFGGLVNSSSKRIKGTGKLSVLVPAVLTKHIGIGRSVYQ